MEHLVEAQAEIIRAILNDLKFNDKPRVFRELIDDIGLYVTAFPEGGARNFYEASVRAYTRMAPSGNMPTFSDVMLELESMADKHVGLWKQKYAEKQNTRHNYIVAAKILMNYMLGAEAKDVIAVWLNELKESSDVRAEIASLVNMLVNLATDGGQESRPSAILRRAREVGIKEPRPTGFDSLNRVWEGGWHNKGLYVLAMPSGAGKTSSCVSFVCERARQGRPSLINSFEQPSEEILFKALCNLSSVLTLEQVENPDKNIRSQEEWDALQYAEKTLDKWVRIYDQSCKPAEIAMRVRRHQAEFGPSLDWTAIDHIGAFGEGGKGAAERSYELESYAKFMKQDVSNKYGVTSLLYSQVSEEMEKQLRETNDTNTDALRGSRGIKMWADVLAVGCRHNTKMRGASGKLEYNPEYTNVSVFKTTKFRRSGVAADARVGLRYDAPHHRLLNVEVPV